MEIVKFGIIGIGNMGSSHAKNFMEGKIDHGQLTAVADIDDERLQCLHKLYGDKLKYYNTAEKLIESGSCDAVVVATPHYDHPKYIIKALQAGLHALSEKPAGVYTKQVREMNEVAKVSSKLFAVMFNQRTNPIFIKMRELIADNSIGDIKRVNWIITNWYRCQGYYDSGSWRATWAGEGGGVLYNQCPHNLDLLQWITGQMPSLVEAHCHLGKWHNIEVEDDVTAYFEYKNGATGLFVTSTADAPGTNRLEILGDRGRLIYDNDTLIYDKLDVSEREFCMSDVTGFAKPKVERVDIKVEEGSGSQHVGILSNFARAILGTEALYVDGAEGIKGVELANCMTLSSWLGHSINLPIDEDLYWSELSKRIATSKLKKPTKAVVVDVEGSFGGSK